jgi:hyperosmotically inducible protein
MVRTLLRFILLIVVVAAITAFFLGYRFADRGQAGGAQDAVGTTGGVVVDGDRTDGVDLGHARETGARIGERVAVGASRAEGLARDAGLTAKIKSKMALDDLVKARTIDVDTIDGAVTLSGSVGSIAERDRAVRLARETEGVTSVTERLTIER